MTLPRLVQEFAPTGCFTLDEAVQATGIPRPAIKKEIEYLQSRGYLESVRRGIYALEPTRSHGTDPDPFVIASKVARPYLLSYHSALELHGMAESAFFNQVTVSTPKKVTPFTWRKHDIRFVSADAEVLSKGHSTVRHSGVKLDVASPELTVIHCADRPELAGGFNEILASIRGFPYLDWSPLLELLKLHGKTVLYRKVGYLVQLNADRWRPPDAVLHALRERIGTSATYFGIGSGQGGRYETAWRVIVPGDAPEVSQRA